MFLTVVGAHESTARLLTALMLHASIGLVVFPERIVPVMLTANVLSGIALQALCPHVICAIICSAALTLY